MLNPLKVLIVIAIAIVGMLGSVAAAQDAAASREKVVVLKSGGRLVGRVTEDGDRYRIETRRGLTSVVPKSDVVSMEDAPEAPQTPAVELTTSDSKESRAGDDKAGPPAGREGTVPGARTDIDQIVKRKRDRNDFDVLLVQDMSRFTRGGAEHGMKLEYDLNAANIDLVFAADHLPEGDHGGIIKSVGFYAARQYAKSLSFAVARGMMSSIERGRVAHCLRPPYGIDRLYISLDGKPLHVIRNLADGTQQRLDPDTGAVLGTYEVERGSRRSCHYRMQSNERIVLIPRDPQRVEAVRLMFRRRLIDGWAGFRIACELDAMGVRSGNGKPWCVSSINHILRNPVYTGMGITNRTTQAIYNVRSTNSPKPSTADRKSLAHRGKPGVSVRPREEWVEVEKPLLKDYLGDLRERAVQWQRTQLARHERGHVPTPASKDRHVDSAYFLKGLLHSKQGNHPMSGRLVGNKKNKTRYYAVHRGFTVPSSAGGTMRRLIPAGPLEEAVLKVVRETLTVMPDLRQRLTRIIRQQATTVTADTADLSQLQSERANLQAQLELVIDSLGSIGKDAAKAKLRQIEARIGALDERIARATVTAAPAKANDVATTVERLMAELKTLGDSIDTLPKPALRQLLAAMVIKLEVDLDTKSVEIVLALPEWAALPRLRDHKAMCLADSFVHRTGHEAHRVVSAEIAIFRCDSVRAMRQPTCYSCKRSRAA